jgi:integrase/recombinase XerD
LFCGNGKKNNGRRLAGNAINAVYYHYKNVVFPKVLKDPLVPEEDKPKIRDLLKKAWNPYVRRHTIVTEMHKTVEDPEVLNAYFGWSRNSKMLQRYTHYYADDFIDTVLTEMDGITTLPSQIAKNKAKNLLKPKLCPNCEETNKPESKFCTKCKFVLTFEAFNESITASEQRRKNSNK